jgi:hypothetical protein
MLRGEARQRDAYYRRQDVSTFRALTIVLPGGRTITERPPTWFVRRVMAARGVVRQQRRGGGMRRCRPGRWACRVGAVDKSPPGEGGPA